MFKDFQNDIFNMKYKDEKDNSIQDMWKRVSKAIANGNDYDVERFYNLQDDFKFIPGGRINNGAGTKNNYLINCFVLGVDDSLEDIFETVKRASLIFKKNGGCGFSLHKLRPKDAKLSNGGSSSGVVSFMEVFDVAGKVIKSGGHARRAAQIAILPINHPEIEDFIDAKRQEGILTQFNISVGITDEFISAVENNKDFDLTFNGKVYKTVKARYLFDKLVHSGWMYNDPGFLYLDEVNRYNNMSYSYNLHAVNPCGEITLPEWGVCCLGNINLTKFITSPFTDKAKFDVNAYKEVVRSSVRFLDNVLDVTDYPFEENRKRAQGERRLGLNGFSGLGDALAMLKIKYDSKEALDFVDALGQVLVNAAYFESVILATEKGVFEDFDPKFCDARFINEVLNENVKNLIRKHGIRNCSILTVPPVGTGSMLAGNISSGLEPIFDLQYNRKINMPDGTQTESLMEDYAWGMYKELTGWKSGDKIPEYFQTAKNISPKAHIDMQAAIQKWTDNSISKTCNLPASCTEEEYAGFLLYALKSGVKGFTTYRSGTRDSVLSSIEEPKENKEYISPVKPTKTVKPERDRVLDGKTYKVKNNTGNIYVTVNHNSSKHLSEVFMFSSNENQELYAALGKILSAVMRTHNNIDFIIDDLRSIKASTDAGGYLTKEYGFVRSFPQHLSYILEEHINSIDNSKDKTDDALSICPECGQQTLKHDGACAQCLSCLYSKCG